MALLLFRGQVSSKFFWTRANSSDIAFVLGRRAPNWDTRTQIRTLRFQIDNGVPVVF